MSNWKVRVDENYILVERNGSSDVAWIAAQLKVKDALGGAAPEAQPQTTAPAPAAKAEGRRARLQDTGDAAKSLGLSTAQLRILGDLHRVPVSWEGKRRRWDVAAVRAAIAEKGPGVLRVTGEERKSFADSAKRNGVAS